MTDHARYFEDLTRELRARGVPAEKTDVTVEELSGFVAEARTAPETEFGPVAELADGLAARGESVTGPEPEPGAQQWVWTCDMYVDHELLNTFGAQGWEVERIDKIGRFVSRRDGASPMRWEYRREDVKRKDRVAKATELAPAGWEPCGHWTFLAYYKRPVAALEGPAAELTSAPEVPGRRTYFTRRTKALLTVAAVCWLALAAFLSFDGVSTGVGSGMLVGGAIGGIAGWLGARRDVRRGTRGTIHGVPGVS